MKDKTFVITIISLVILSIFPVGFFNYLIDPMWTFNQSNPYNDVQTVINERQQKTNTIHFQPFEYDTLLLGSSRSTYINQHEFKDMSVYNYAVSDMSILEYKSFLDFAKREKGSEFKTIILGLDFFKTSVQESKPLSIDDYVAAANEPFYRYKNLLSKEILEYSWRNYQMSRADKIVEVRNYNRENVASAMAIDPDVKIDQTTEKIQKFRDVFYGDTYEYNPEYKNILKELKENNPKTSFIVFTTPISTELFQALVDEGRLEDYDQWLRDIISEFGGVYNFMYPNSVTNDIYNYFDGHHFYPHVGTFIAHRISNPSDPSLPHDFGQYIDANGIDAHLLEIRELSNQLVTKKNER